MVADDDYTGIFQSAILDRIPILPRGFYVGYPIGKNAAGHDFPTDRSGEDSIYGGRSIWGQIDTIAERYKWSLDYILWGASWANIQLMMADALRTDYKSKGESEKASDIPNAIDLNNANAMNRLMQLAGSK